MYKIEKQQENSRENGAENYIQYFVISYNVKEGLPRWFSDKESACQCRKYRRCGFDFWVGKIPLKRK